MDEVLQRLRDVQSKLQEVIRDNRTARTSSSSIPGITTDQKDGIEDLIKRAKVKADGLNLTHEEFDTIILELGKIRENADLLDQQDPSHTSNIQSEVAQIKDLLRSEFSRYFNIEDALEEITARFNKDTLVEANKGNIKANKEKRKDLKDDRKRFEKFIDDAHLNDDIDELKEITAQKRKMQSAMKAVDELLTEMNRTVDPSNIDEHNRRLDELRSRVHTELSTTGIAYDLRDNAGVQSLKDKLEKKISKKSEKEAKKAKSIRKTIKDTIKSLHGDEKRKMQELLKGVTSTKDGETISDLLSGGIVQTIDDERDYLKRNNATIKGINAEILANGIDETDTGTPTPTPTPTPAPAPASALTEDAIDAMTSGQLKIHDPAYERELKRLGLQYNQQLVAEPDERTIRALTKEEKLDYCRNNGNWFQKLPLVRGFRAGLHGNQVAAAKAKNAQNALDLYDHQKQMAEVASRQRLKRGLSTPTPTPTPAPTPAPTRTATQSKHQKFADSVYAKLSQAADFSDSTKRTIENEAFKETADTGEPDR